MTNNCMWIIMWIVSTRVDHMLPLHLRRQHRIVPRYSMWIMMRIVSIMMALHLRRQHRIMLLSMLSTWISLSLLQSLTIRSSSHSMILWWMMRMSDCALMHLSR